LLLLAFAGCGESDNQRAEQAARDEPARREPTSTLRFVADEATPLRWTKETYRTPAGDVELKVTNPSQAVHGVAVERSATCCRQPGSKQLGYTKTIDTGETTRTVVSLPAGRYWAYCNVDGHWQGGMLSRLVVE
jgi:hypothetical protein